MNDVSAAFEGARAHARDPGFEQLMAEQIRHAPWLALSVVLHFVLVLLLVVVMRGERPDEEPTVVAVQPSSEAPPIEPPPPPPERPPVEQRVAEDPVLDQLEVVEEPTEVTPLEAFDDMPSVASAFDSVGLNTAIGVGGGAAGKYGNRGGGGGGGGRGGRERRTAVDAALRWLADHQDGDGRWDADDFMKHDTDGVRCDGAGASVHDVGVSGLALLAFLGDGNTLRSGPYRETVRRGVDWLRGEQDPETGLVGRPNSNEFVYGHALATLALVEASGLSDSRLLRPYAQRALEYLEYHRNPYGVWRYQPRDGDNDTSVTGWCVLAYESARDFGFEVNEQALTYAVNWFDAMTDESGRVGYTERGGLSSRKAGEHRVAFPPESGECMTAVALMCRFFLGQDPDSEPIMHDHARLIVARPPAPDVRGAVDHYYWYYGSYALFQYGGRAWDNWRRTLSGAVVETQRSDGNFRGSWDPAGAWGEDGGRVYSTAILALTLQAYSRYSRLIR